MGNREKASSIAIGAAIALTLAAPAAQATTTDTTDWGVHDTIESASEHVAKGSFDDIFSFSLPSASDLLSFAVSVEKIVFVGKPPKEPKSIFSIDDGTVKLYQGIFGDATPDTLKLSYQFNNGGGLFHASGPLGPGDYFYEVSGKGVGQGGGFFNLTSGILPSTISPVPEPETYGMLLAGLGLMGIIARRRTKNS